MKQRLIPRLFSVIVLCCVSIGLSAEWHDQKLDTETFLHLKDLARAEAPRIVGGYIVFSYVPDHPVRHVAIAFEHDGYGRVRTLSRNEHGVYLYLLAPEPGMEEVVYRYVIDGLWMTDPFNPETAVDERGVKLSEFTFYGSFPEIPASPVITKDGTVELYYAGEPGRHIYLNGDFTHWDPFIYRLKETNPGVYRFSLALPPGVHRYQFVVKGQALTDPLNPLTAIRGDGRRVSVVVVE